MNGMSMPNARVTSHVSAAMTSHSGNDHRNAIVSARGSRATAKPPLKVLCQLRRAASRHARAAARARSRTTARRCARDATPAPTSRPSARPPPAPRAPPRPRSAAQQRRRQRGRVGEAPHEDREQRQHGDQVEHALHDDRRKVGRRAEAFLTGEQIRAQQIAGPGRQQRQRRKSDHRRAECRAEPRGADRREQVLPADRARPRTSTTTSEQRRRTSSSMPRAAAPASTHQRDSRGSGTTRTGQSPEAIRATVRTSSNVVDRGWTSSAYHNISGSIARRPVVLRTVAGRRSVPVRCRASLKDISRCRSHAPCSTHV